VERDVGAYATKSLGEGGLLCPEIGLHLNLENMIKVQKLNLKTIVNKRR